MGPALDYAKWENFAKVIKRAMIACENSGHSIPDDFPEVRKIVEAGVTTKPKKDYELSRHTGRKLLTTLMNWTKITEDLLSGESTELIANLFRISQTEEKLRKDKIVGAETATSVHYNVGKEVRTAIERQTAFGMCFDWEKGVIA